MRTSSAGRATLGRWCLRHLHFLPVLLLVGGALFDYATSPHVSAEAFYTAAPMTAAALLSLRATILAGIGACAADAALLTHFGLIGDSGGWSELAAVVTVSALAIVVNRLMYYSYARMQSARRIALAAQRAVLPQPPASIGPLRIAVRYQAAVKDAQIGGDLYSAQDTPFGVRCLVGDVRGKGLDAVKVVAVAMGAFREAAEEEPTLVGVAARLERALLRERCQRTGPERIEGFVTGVLVEIPPRHDQLRLLNRGHPPPLVLHAGRVHTAEPSVPAPPLGLAELGTGQDRTDTVPFPSGATLLLYTDGLNEARNRAGDFYDPTAGLTGVEFPGPDALLDALLSEVNRHSAGRITDDMALLAVTRTPPSSDHGPQRRVHGER
ncbi:MULTISPECIES: PP2C family protein-serine/threonine phosphatase [Streptomyces]|uniref:Serine/threonine-protein phosphatase n=1 Tax=Streptomyces yunnanensis TaxID=156453 RepID=A0ABY8A0Q2_9ACTN|nr:MULTISPECIES: PP2C family protein-serine/threonine phosphatase [Streptomyces]AJC53297.1 integral membrane protein [Streptomyces sp. 769]WEB38341.1 serine/threonine-protein phosphatase [Streptomyces yunnanensis]